MGLVLAGGVVARLWRLGSLPGINGDEAWYGIQAARLLRGESVAWLTPSGLPLNPFFTGLELPFLAVLPPRFWVLRVPAAISGLLAVALVAILGRRATDRVTARLATILLAVLPISIGYSRFGWDASQTPLFGVLAVMAALRGQTVATGLAFGAGLLVHPTNAFLYPALAVPWGIQLWQREAARPRRRALLLGLAIAAGVVLYAALARQTPGLTSGVTAGRLMPGAIGTTLLRFGRLFSGVTLYQFIVGPMPWEVVAWHDLAFWSVAGILAGLGLRGLIAARQTAALGLLAGTVVALMGFHLIAGPDALAPHFERYAMFLVPPGVFCLALLARAILPEAGATGLAAGERPLVAVWALLGVVWLGVFQREYLAPLVRDGGHSHPAFRTARDEPKQRALDRILRELDRSGSDLPARIVAEDWWLEQPLAYLASGQEGLEVDGTRTWPVDPVARRARVREALADGAYLVGFADGSLEADVHAAATPRSLRRTVVRDPAGRPLIVVYRDRFSMLARDVPDTLVR